MSVIDEKVRKGRAYAAEYAQRPDVKEDRRVASVFRSRRLTLVTTLKRIRSHTMDDLVDIMHMCYQDDPDKFEVDKDAIMITLTAMKRGVGNVQSNLVSEDISS